MSSVSLSAETKAQGWLLDVLGSTLVGLVVPYDCVAMMTCGGLPVELANMLVMTGCTSWWVASDAECAVTSGQVRGASDEGNVMFDGGSVMAVEGEVTFDWDMTSNGVTDTSRDNVSSNKAVVTFVEDVISTKGTFTPGEDMTFCKGAVTPQADMASGKVAVTSDDPSSAWSGGITDDLCVASNCSTAGWSKPGGGEGVNGSIFVLLWISSGLSVICCNGSCMLFAFRPGISSLLSALSEWDVSGKDDDGRVDGESIALVFDSCSTCTGLTLLFVWWLSVENFCDSGAILTSICSFEVEIDDNCLSSPMEKNIWIKTIECY